MSAEPRIYQFTTQMEFSRNRREQTDLAVLTSIITGAVSADKTNTDADKGGVDYVVTLRNGAEVLVDAKTRAAGCSRWWHDGPELALEKWSVMPGGRYNTPAHQQKTGWTLNEQSNVDYILFTFDPQDSERVYLIPFQLLRIAFIYHIYEWYERYKVDTQHSHSNGVRWQSEAVFVPARVVIGAVVAVMEGAA